MSGKSSCKYGQKAGRPCSNPAKELGLCVEHLRELSGHIDRTVRAYDAAQEEAVWNKELRRDEDDKSQHPDLNDEMVQPRCTDLGNALRFARSWHEVVVYVPEARGWFCWTGRVWQHDKGNVEMLRLAGLTVRGMFIDAAKHKDKDLRDAELSWARKSEAKERLLAMIDLAKVYCRKRHYTDFDSHPNLFNANNGTIDLRTGQGRPFDRRDYMTILTPVDYKPNESKPMARWYEFLSEIQPGHDACCLPFIQQMVGYWMTGEIREECFFVLYGPLGRNGKGTFIETLTYVLGNWVGDASFDTFVAKRGDEKLNDIAGFRGKRLIIASESEASKRLAEAKLKRMTGGDRVVGEFKYQEQFSYRPTYKITLITNYKPKVIGTDNGIWDRIHLLEFPAYFSPETKDPLLKETLKSEAEEILRWAVRGAVEWYKHGLQISQCVEDNTRTYRQDQNVLGQFVEEQCTIGPGLTVGKKDLYDAYKFWADQTGEFVMGQVEFWERMDTQFEAGRSAKGKIYKGLGLKMCMSLDPEQEEGLAQSIGL